MAFLWMFLSCDNIMFHLFACYYPWKISAYSHQMLVLAVVQVLHFHQLVIGLASVGLVVAHWWMVIFVAVWNHDHQKPFLLLVVKLLSFHQL